MVREFRLADVPQNPELRERLLGRDREELVADLEKRWPDLAVETDVSSKRRVVRAFEIAEYREIRPVRYGKPPGLSLRFLVFGIDAPREKLRRRIGLRLRARL